MLKQIYDNGGKHFLCFIIFNIIFAVFGLSLKYASPFIISLLLTVWLQPVSKFIQSKTKAKPFIINIISVLVALSFLLGLFSLIGLGVFKETSAIVKELSLINIDGLIDKLDSFKIYLESISPDILNQLIQYIQGLAGHVISYVSVIGNWLIKVVGFVPVAIINTIIILLSTYYLMRDYDTLANKFNNFKIGNSELPTQLLRRVNSIIVNYIQSYSILLFITFVECMVVFWIFDIKYLFTLSIICVILDVLPIVGTTVIYIPIAIMFFIQGKPVAAIWIIIFYCIFVVIRNVLEPKLLSKSLDIHPVLILISIYVGVSIAGVIGIIYCIFLITFFKLLKEVDIL